MARVRVRERGVVRVVGQVVEEKLALAVRHGTTTTTAAATPLGDQGCRPRHNLVAVVVLGAIVGFTRDEAADKGAEGGDGACDDGEVDFDAGPEGDVYAGDCWNKKKRETC